jgi:hypothetical protein
MENQSNQATKKGIILLLGVIVGLLTGVLVTFVMVNKLNQKTQPPDKQNVPASEAGTTDTIYKYIVHRYEPGPHDAHQGMPSDTVSSDSMYVDESSMDYMLDEEEYPVYAEKENTNVSSAKLVSKEEAPILYFDAGRNPVKAPENAPKFVEVQFWSTPIQNKVVYKFGDNVLKIKGLKSNDVYVIHYKEHFYLQCDKKVYQIAPSTEYVRLTEIQESSFF